MANDTFHYFPQLPLELRRMIWEHCLPRRVAQVDPCDAFFDGRKPEQVCAVRSVTIENTRQPVIAFVNHESRQVALEQGRWLREKEETNAACVLLPSFWIQRRRDVLHLNWTPERSDNSYRFKYEDGESWLFMFLYRADELRMERSIVADAIHPFNLHALLDSADDEVVSESPFIKYESWKSVALPDMAWYTLEWSGYQLNVDVVMAAISLHITRESAVRSGLFGLLGDAPIQLIGVGDEIRLREYEGIYREHALDKEPKVQKIFEVLMSPQFQAAVETWKREAEWLIFASIWQAKTKESDLNGIGLDTASFWEPRLHKRDYVRIPIFEKYIVFDISTELGFVHLSGKDVEIIALANEPPVNDIQIRSLDLYNISGRIPDRLLFGANLRLFCDKRDFPYKSLKIANTVVQTTSGCHMTVLEAVRVDIKPIDLIKQESLIRTGELIGRDDDGEKDHEEQGREHYYRQIKDM
ncbi:hypothetical protein TCE0_044r16299 [Talaromyces pinophilus]|uniref:2EXR domain-containing protein n=1 Tax=Talaromyces pinophilus TaxID=128442 RepID=A0A478ECB8_TALPI|nr:hypothetical protein TCE0_044r16299 [Talaromyces pinophilus]